MSMSGNHRERTVPHDHGRRLFDLLTGYPTVRICRDIIRQYVFERPLIINGAAPKETETHARELQEDWKKLKHEIFDHAMALGFVAVRVRPGEVPNVVPWDCYRATIEVNDAFETVLRAYPVREEDGTPDKPLKNVVILDMFGYTPNTHTGEIQSPLAPVHHRVYHILDELNNMLYADRARARPPVYTESTEDGVRPADEVNYDYYADAESLERTSRNAYQRNEDAVAELRGQQEMLDSYFRGHGSSKDKCADAIDSLAPLPHGQKISRGPECSAPEQLVERLRYWEQECFSLLGVPRSFVMHDITVRHDAGMLHCSFTRTVHAWQDGLGNALTYLWNVSKAPNVTRRRKRARLVAPAYELRFERMPRVGVAELNHAYDRGVCTWEAYQRMIGTFAGFAPKDLVKGAEPWTREEKLLGWTAQKPKSEFTKESNAGK